MTAQLQRHLGDDNARCLAGRPFGGATCRSRPRRPAARLAMSRTRNLYHRDRVLLPTLPPDHRAMLRSQSGPHAGSWLAAIPGEASTHALAGSHASCASATIAWALWPVTRLRRASRLARRPRASLPANGSARSQTHPAAPSGHWLGRQPGQIRRVERARFVEQAAKELRWCLACSIREGSKFAFAAFRDTSTQMSKVPMPFVSNQEQTS